MKRGRKPIEDKTVNVSGRIPVSLLERLKEYTEVNRITTSAFISQLLEKALDPSRGSYFTKEEVDKMVDEARNEELEERSSFVLSYAETLEKDLHDAKSLIEQFKEYSTELETKLRNCTDLYRSEAWQLVSRENYKKITPTIKRPKA